MSLETQPHLSRFDRQCRQRTGARLLGGIDEAGRGALAGPVVAACVVLEPGTRLPGVNDSKCLLPEDREALAPLIIQRAAAWGVGLATADEIDRINILQATLLAAQRAISTLSLLPEYMLTDFLRLPNSPCPFEPLVDGDARSQAIAAASILAKVARDRIMATLHGEYPVYNFFSHKGYGTPEHWTALQAHGPSTLHRLTYNGVCFFDTAPSIRALNGGQKLYGARRCPDVAWLHVLTSPPSALDPLAFLPECEWEWEAVLPCHAD